MRQELAQKRQKIVLVTGGAGFLGSHLCDRLLEAGNKVICVDNLYTGSLENLKSALKNKKFKFIEHDIIKPLQIAEHVDEIYNLACPASPVHYQENPVRTIKTSTIGVINILGLARKHNARVFQASTSEVYGNPLVHPQTEEYWGNVNPIGPRSCYDEGKRCAETLFFDYHRMHGMEIKVVRIFNTYGPRMSLNDGRVMSNFILQALNNEDITIYGNGKQTRSFCYVDDLIKGIVLMMNAPAEVTGPINLGNPSTEVDMIGLAKFIIKYTGSKSKIVCGPLPQDDPERRKPDITKAKKILKWTPKINLQKGIKKTIEFFKETMF